MGAPDPRTVEGKQLNAQVANSGRKLTLWFTGTEAAPFL